MDQLPVRPGLTVTASTRSRRTVALGPRHLFKPAGLPCVTKRHPCNLSHTALKVYVCTVNQGPSPVPRVIPYVNACLALPAPSKRIQCFSALRHPCCAYQKHSARSCHSPA